MAEIVSFPLVAAGKPAMDFTASIVTTRIGLTWGRWMRRLRR